MNENIENIIIEPREARKFRTQLREEVRGTRKPNNLEIKKSKKKLHKNYIYFRELNKKIRKYPKIDEIKIKEDLEDDEKYRLPKPIGIKEIHAMTELLLKKPKEKEKVQKNEECTKEKNNKREDTPRRVTRNMAKQKENEEIQKKNTNNERKNKMKIPKKLIGNDKKNKVEEEEEREYRKTIKDIPTEFGVIHLEILLINSLGITADKVQQMAEGFMVGKNM